MSLPRSPQIPSPAQSQASLSIWGLTSNIGGFTTLGSDFTLNSPLISLIISPIKWNWMKYFTPPQLLGYVTVFYNSIYRLSYITGRPEWPGRPGRSPPQYFRQVGAYEGSRGYSKDFFQLHKIHSNKVKLSFRKRGPKMVCQMIQTGQSPSKSTLSNLSDISFVPIQSFIHLSTGSVAYLGFHKKGPNFSPPSPSPTLPLLTLPSNS